jgi:hypothetical protein
MRLTSRFSTVVVPAFLAIFGSSLIFALIFFVSHVAAWLAFVCAIPIGLLILWMSHRFARVVHLVGEELHIRSGGKSAVVPLKNLRYVEVIRPGRRPSFIIVYLWETSEFGREIAFTPKLRGLDLIVRRLREAMLHNDLTAKPA